VEVKVLQTINQCTATDWDRLFDADYPFIRHAFLELLESSGSVCAATGWQPQHLLLTEGDNPVAAVPLYLKQHSWGEYVFDHAWADAYHRHNINYYPKLVTSIPFTPATGPRLGMNSSLDAETLLPAIMASIQQLASHTGASGWHLLFSEPELAKALEAEGAMQRTGVQYHWHNASYHSFDDFARSLTSRKRKTIMRERSRAQSQLHIRVLEGQQITDDWWKFFHIMYQRTYLKRSGSGGYLTEDFFTNLGDAMGGQVMMCVAETNADNDPVSNDPSSNSPASKVAAALFFFDHQTLYGRYWGCLQEYDFLHFELCYYQGIEFAIEKGLSRFDAGAQGEHKIKRGFQPVETHSSHWISHPGFAEAIQQFLIRETAQVGEYISQACELLPYKNGNT
jgi:predicted N-acyltransferase